MSRHSLLLFTVLLLTSSLLPAQSPEKSEQMLYNLMSSGILKTYKDYRSETEKYVALFKARQEEYRVEDMIELKSTYERTAEAFEDYIYEIRNDLLDKKKRKAIKKDPEAYVTARLSKLNQVYAEYYQTRFRPAYAAICEDPSTVAQMGRRTIPPEIPIALIAPITKATMDIITYIDGKNTRDLESLKTLLEKEWVEPNRFRSWEDI
ncbi:MAG: hypothetical protein AAFQ87_12700 [Bacteroidota bacterium]